MTKRTNHLIRVANLMSAKYASIDAATIATRVKEALQQAIGAASTARVGILPFLSMLKADSASFSINVVRDGNSITVSPPALDKPELAAKYAPLSGQIQSYLEKNLEIFPSKLNDQNVEYHNLTTTLTFADGSAQPVANL